MYRLTHLTSRRVGGTPTTCTCGAQMLRTVRMPLMHPFLTHRFYATSTALQQQQLQTQTNAPVVIPHPPPPPQVQPSFQQLAPLASHELSLREASALELPPPGTVAPKPAPVPYRPRKPLNPRLQAKIDSQLKELRRREHPQWIDKPFERKMTLLERQQLLTGSHQKWDLEKLSRMLEKCRNPLASLHYIDRAHDWFIRCYTFAPVSTYERMIVAAGRFKQFERADEYYKLMLQYHQPRLKTLHHLLFVHSQNGHTKKIIDLLEQMSKGSLSVVADKVPKSIIDLVLLERSKKESLNKLLLNKSPATITAALLPSSATTTPADSKSTETPAADAVAVSANTSLATTTPPSTGVPEVYDPTDPRYAFARRLAKNAVFRFPFSAKALSYLLQSHMVNNDTQAILELMHKLRHGEEIYPTFGPPIQLTLQIAELAMVYYGQQRLLKHAIELMDWIESERLPISVNAAWWFFEGFKRELTYQRLEQQGDRGLRAERERRRRTAAVDIDAIIQEGRKQIAPPPEFDPLRLPINALEARKPLPAHLQKKHRLAPDIRDPFPATVASKSKAEPHHRTFPQSPLRIAERTLLPTVVDKKKETLVTFEEVITFMIQTWRFLPTVNLFNQYLAYYGENFYPPLGQFPDVMMEQVRVFRTVCQNKELLDSVRSTTPDFQLFPHVDSTTALRSRNFTPFVPNAQTYALLIQALMDRQPLRPSSIASITIHQPGPSKEDLAHILRLKQEMRELEIEPTLATKVNTMQLMVYEEKWTDLYASFTLLWKREQLRRDEKLKNLQQSTPSGAPTPTLETMLKTEAEEEAKRLADESSHAEPLQSEEGEPTETKEKEEEEVEEEVETTASSVSRSTLSHLHSAAPFTCMSLLPVFISLSQRLTLERLNLFFGIISAAREFPLTRQFFQCILQILADRGQTKEIIQLMKIMKKKYRMQPKVQQYNTLLSSMLDQQGKQALPRQNPSEDILPTNTPPIKVNPKEILTNMFQTFELMKMLKVGYDQTTLYILMQGCLEYGELIDGERLWHWMRWKTLARPTRPMYALYTEFLLKHDKLVHALGVLRSQSLQDGMDWTLKEVYMILDYIKSDKFIKLANSELRSDALTVHVPNEAQLKLYQSIKSQSESLSLALLEWEKKGGKISRPGVMDVLPKGAIESPRLSMHRTFHSPIRRQRYRTAKEKEEDEVLNLSTIPPKLYWKYMQTLEKEINQFTGADVKLNEVQTKKNQVKLLEQSELTQRTQARDQQTELFKQIDDLKKELFEDNLQSSDSKSSDDTPSTSTPTASTPSPKPKSAPVHKPLPAGLDPAEGARRKAEKAALKAIKVTQRAQRQQEAQMKKAKTKAIIETSPISADIQRVLTELSAKVSIRPLEAVVSEPAHPVMFNDINLCQLRHADQLGTLDIDQLKAIQTHPSLLGQPKELVKGKKGHHLQLVRTWLEHCSCGATHNNNSTTKE